MNIVSRMISRARLPTLSGSIQNTGAEPKTRSDFKNLFFYWTGHDYILIKRLRELMFEHSAQGRHYTPIFINDRNLAAFVPDLPRGFFQLSPPFKADFIRVYVIARYGGIWVDADTLVMDHLASLFSVIQERDGFFITEGEDRICNGVFGSRPRTEFMREWFKFAWVKLDSSRKTRWGEIGNSFLTRRWKTDCSSYADYQIFHGPSTMYPVNWDVAEESFLSGDEAYESIRRNYQPLIILVNSVYKAVENDPDVLRSTVLGRLLSESRQQAFGYRGGRT
jgi:hypothetical protein